MSVVFVNCCVTSELLTPHTRSTFISTTSSRARELHNTTAYAARTSYTSYFTTQWAKRVSTKPLQPRAENTPSKRYDTSEHNEQRVFRQNHCNHVLKTRFLNDMRMYVASIGCYIDHSTLIMRSMLLQWRAVIQCGAVMRTWLSLLCQRVARRAEESEKRYCPLRGCVCVYVHFCHFIDCHAILTDSAHYYTSLYGVSCFII